MADDRNRRASSCGSWHIILAGARWCAPRPTWGAISYGTNCPALPGQIRLSISLAKELLRDKTTSVNRAIPQRHLLRYLASEKGNSAKLCLE